MKLRGQLLVLSAVMAMLVCMSGLQTHADPPAGAAADYPVPYKYREAHYSQYKALVAEYVKAHPDDPASAHALLDLIVEASALPDPQTVGDMTRQLLLDYSTSPEAKFIVNQVRDPREFEQLMYSVFATSVEDKDIPADLPGKFTGAMRLGAGRFGIKAFPALTNFMVFASEMAREAGDPSIVDGIKAVLDQAGDNGKLGMDVIKLLADDKTPLLDRIQKLHAMSQHDLTIPFERFLVNKLSKDDQAKVPVQKILVDDLLIQGSLDEARKILDKLPADALDSRLLFWQAWITASKHDVAKAADQLKALAAKSPNDAWGKLALQYAPAVAAEESSMAASVDALMPIFNRLRSSADLIEFSATYIKDKDVPVKIYVGAVADRLFEVRVSEGDKTTVAYTSTDKDCMVYYDYPGEHKLYKYGEQGSIAAPKLGWNGTSVTMSQEGQYLKTPDQVMGQVAQLADLPIFQNIKGMTDWLKNMVEAGELPLIPAGNTVMTFVWVQPDPTEAKMNEFKYTVDTKKFTMTLSHDKFTIDSLRILQKADNGKLSPPPFPSTTGVETGGDKLVNKEITGRVLAVLQQTLAPATTQPTTKPAAP